jgi:hypothetical protein
MMIPIFLNGRAVDGESDGTLRSLVARHAPDLLSALLDGSALATDGRALPVSAETPLVPGGIFQVKLSAREVVDHDHD